MTGYLTTNRLARIDHLPIALAQTELKAATSVPIVSFYVAQGQRLELSYLSLGLLRVLTAGAVPVFLYSSQKLCSVGLYRESVDCSPLALAALDITGSACANPFRKCTIEAPGNYRVIVRNNSSNVDLSVVVTGIAKLYR